MERQDLLNRLARRVSEKRLKHTLGTEQMAVELARRFGEDEQKASLAALLHDYAKNLSEEELLAAAEEYSLPVDALCAAHPALLHGPVAAELARRELGVTDEDVLNAVCYHTIGRGGMSALEQIIYMADLIEPNRTYADAAVLRAAAREQTLEQAFLLCASYLLQYLVRSRTTIHSGQVDAYNDALTRAAAALQ